MFTKEDLKMQMAQMGLLSTDTVLIHTSFKAVGQVENGPNGFLDTFCEYLKDGLFLVPTHTWSNVTPTQPVYNVNETVPCIGLIPRTAAFRKDGTRSLHPTHSIWTHGRNAAEFVEGEEYAETPAPQGFCWSRLADVGAKILLIGVGNKNNTFIHSIDERAGLDGRLADAPWDVTIVDRNGNQITHPFRNHGRTGSENFDNFETPLVALGAQTFGQLGDASVRIVDAKRCQDVIMKIYSRTSEHLCLVRQEIPEVLWR